MRELKKVLSYVQEGIKEEVSGIKKLKGEKLNTFCDIFSVPEGSLIYFNQYNILITDPELNEIISGFCKSSSLVLKVEVPEHNAHLWVYQYFNDQLFESYLGE